MTAQSIWGALRRFLTLKIKKTRVWKRICLIASFFGAGASFIGLVTPTLVEINELSFTLRTFAFAGEYHETVHAKSTQFLGFSISFLALIVAQAIYSFVFWPGYDRVVLRTSTILVFVPVNLVLAWVQFTTLDGIFSLPIDPIKSNPHSIGVPEDEIQDHYDHIARGMGKVKLLVPIVSVFLGIVYCGVVVFWLWLLPSRHRLPNRYEPVIVSKEGSRSLVNRGPESIELTEIPMSDSAGRLEAIFREHENARVHNLLTLGTNSPLATTRRRVGMSPRAPRRSGTGPQLAPDARYWMLSNAEDGLKLWVIGMISFIVFGLGFEIPAYVILRENDLKCLWYCHSKIYHPVVFAVWLAAFMLLLVYRIPLNRRLLKVIRIDVVLLVSLCISWAFWLVVHVPRYTYPSQDERKYLTSLAGTPLEHPYEIVSILQTLITALGTMFAFILVWAIGYWLYGDFSGRFYYM